MQKYRDIVIDNNGNSITSATITVTNNVGGSVSTIYSDNGVTAKANPFTSSAIDGVYEFYAANGRYDITITKTGYDTESIVDVVIEDNVGLSSTDTDDGTKGFHLVNIPPLTGETGVVNYEYEPLNVLRYHDGTNDPAVGLQAAVDSAVALHSNGVVGKGIYLPNNPENGGIWDWGTTQVEFEDITGAKQASLHLVTDNPTFIECTSNIQSLFRTGYRNKARIVSIGNLHVDINGFALTSIVLRGESHLGGDHDIEVSDTATTGSCQYIVKHDDAISNAGTGSGTAIYGCNFERLYDSGVGAIKAACLYSNYSVDCTFRNLFPGKSATYGIEFVSTEGVIRGSTIEEVHGATGVSTLTACVRLEESGNTISRNTVKKLYGNLLATYGVSQAFASGLIEENIYEVMPNGWATSAFNATDDGNNILDNTYIEDYSGTFTGTLTGCTTTPTGTIRYTKNGSRVVLDIPDISGTSNATTMTITGLPSALTPITTTQWVLLRNQDNGTGAIGIVRMNTSSVMDFRSNTDGGAYTASGTKGVQACSITYDLN